MPYWHARISLSLTSTTVCQFIATTLLAVASLLLPGCHPSQAGSTAHPTIEFTSVPVAGADNPDKLSPIEGRVFGAQPGQQIVIYARGQTTWWVQPFADRPFTKIQRNSIWTSSTHPGVEYAALLVGSAFQPPLTTGALPSEGVFALATVKGEAPFWQRWWFPPVCMLIGATVIVGAHRLRLTW